MRDVIDSKFPIVYDSIDWYCLIHGWSHFPECYCLSFAKEIKEFGEAFRTFTEYKRKYSHFDNYDHEFAAFVLAYIAMGWFADTYIPKEEWETAIKEIKSYNKEMFQWLNTQIFM